MIRATLAALAVLMLAGCATRADEKIFHALNAIDQAQSIHAISRDCYIERDPITSNLLGKKPAAGAFVAYGLAISTAFTLINRTEYMEDHPRLRTVFNVLAIGAKGYAVAHNHSIGMRMAGNNGACSP